LEGKNMSKFIFYSAIIFMVVWSLFCGVWLIDAMSAMSKHLQQPNPSGVDFSGIGSLAAYGMIYGAWISGFMPAGIVALIAKPNHGAEILKKLNHLPLEKKQEKALPDDPTKEEMPSSDRFSRLAGR
jgi:hypothetical protein